MKKYLQAIMFDFDGVIVDSTRTKTEGFRALFSGYDGETVAKVIDFHKRHGGISRVEKIRHAHRAFLGRPLTEEEVAEWAARFSDLVVEKVIAADWVAGAREVLSTMAGKTLLFLISGTPEEELRHVVEQRGIAGFFAEVYGSPTRKPEHIRKLLNEYQLDPARSVFVGDALTDYHAAKETGVTFIGIESEVEFPVGTTVLPDCRGLMDELACRFTW